MRAQRASLLVAAVVLCQSWLGAATASAQTGGLPDHAHQWSVITGVNAPIVTPPSANFPFGREVHSVNYDYRIMTREVTNTEWLEFVRAFAPHLASTGVGSLDPQFSGNGVERLGFVNGVPQYQVFAGHENRPADPGWRFVARFCNWLQNGKPLPSQSPGGVVPLSAFESGAYDTSTFQRVIDPVSKTPIYLDQPTRSENAQFWIPDSHEWVKAMFWDPNKNGPGEAGYWQYPITSDTAPVSGNPAFGGQTNAGPFPQGQTRPLDVGSYPDVMSPWGLLDGSGGASEWLEDWKNPATPQLRLRGGTASISLFNPATVDRIGGFQQGSPVFAGGGIRLASLVIPAPGVSVTLGAICLGWGGRRRQYVEVKCPVGDRQCGRAIRRQGDVGLFPIV